MKQVLLAGLFHESHSFTDDITGFEKFQVFRGQELLDKKGDGSQIDGFLSVAGRLNWHVVPTVSYQAMPSGLVDHAVFEAFWAEVLPVLADAIQSGLDGVFLSLHGAFVTTKEPDAEGELLRRIRALPGAKTLPVFCLLDLHANLTPAMGERADGLVSYRENPHIDAFDRAVHIAELLARCLDTGVKPKTCVRGAPILWPPTGIATSDSPMCHLEAAGRRMEQEEAGVLAVSVIAGYSFSDVRDAGVSFAILTEGALEDANSLLGKLVHLAWDLRHEGLPEEQEVDDVFRRILPVKEGPVLLVEPADNIGGSAPGDCTDILRALLRHDADRAGVIIADAEAVRALDDIEIGGRKTLSIGGKGSSLDLGPVTLEVVLISRSDGQFQLEDSNSHLAGAFGIYVDMGPSAVVRHGGITILLNSHKTPPFDLGQWRSQGIDPESFAIIAIKAAVAHRRGYDPIVKASYTVKTRGPCASDPKLLPYQHLRRPIFPLDPMDSLQD